MKLTRSISAAARIINNGGIVAFPTDTVFGIGADPFNESAIKKLYAIKGRSDKKPIALLVSSKKIASKFVRTIPSKASKLINKYWPGPLTIIFKKKRSVPDFLTSGLTTIGLRMPDNRTALSLIKAAGGALAVTSANISGKKPAVTLKEAYKLKGVDAVLACGKCTIGVPSSVVAIAGNNVHVLRRGSLEIIG